MIGHTELGYNYDQLIQDLLYYRSLGYEQFSRSVHDSFEDFIDAEEYKNYVINIFERLGDKCKDYPREKLNKEIDKLISRSSSELGDVTLPPTSLGRVNMMMDEIAKSI